MEEIKVGDYVRTIDGYIRKVEQVNKKGSYDGLCHGAYNVDIPYKYSQGISAKKIKSHSPNIIDLIEVGDYVNGDKIVAIDYTEDENGNYKNVLGIMEIDDDYAYPIELRVLNIKSIVTKEMFNQVKYEV